MNDPEVTMVHAPTHTKLIALDKALEAAGIAITLVMRVPAPLRSIADQVNRSASSVPANRGEGHGRTGRDRLHLWRIAYASAKEVDSHLELLLQAGVVNDAKATMAIETFDEVRAMIWRLLNPLTSMAPLKQVAAQEPHPLQSRGFTAAISRSGSSSIAA